MYYKKKHGVALIQLTISFAISSIIALMLYKIFMTTQNSSANLRKVNTLHSMRTLVHYHMQRDFENILLPIPLSTWSDVCEVLGKKEGESEKVAPSGDADNGEDRQKEMQKKYDALSAYLPRVNVQNGITSLSLITANSLLTSTISPCRTRVIYQLVPVKNKTNRYKLMRKEEAFSVSSEDQKKTKEYALMDQIEDPVIQWYIPKINSKELVEKKPEEIEEALRKWFEHPEFEIKKEITTPTADTFFEHPMMPYACLFEGTLLSADEAKKLPIEFIFVYPHAYYVLYSWVMMVVDNHQKNKKQQSGDPTGGPTNPPSPVEQKTVKK